MKIVWNTTEEEHKLAIHNLFKKAIKFEGAVAFVKMSGFGSLRKIIEKGLKDGMEVRFVVGLDFYLTDPEVLAILFRLEKKYSKLKAYISNSGGQVCFHPKIYAFYYNEGITKFLVGSANITAGGFGNNWECSLLVQQEDNKQISKILNSLVESKDVIKITKEKIADYREKHQAARVFRSISEGEIERVRKGEMQPLEPLEAVVRKLRSWEPSPQGLQALSDERAASASEARVLIDTMIEDDPADESIFQENIWRLRDCFHAGLLQIQISRIIKQRKEFRELLRVAKKANDQNQTAREAYKALMRKGILGAGPNWVSEILHALNPTVYAVLNKNSVSGMGLAQIKFPLIPSKVNISGEIYGDFCRSASELSKKLGLKNLSELDAVFNYAYFNYEGEEEE